MNRNFQRKVKKKKIGREALYNRMNIKITAIVLLTVAAVFVYIAPIFAYFSDIVAGAVNIQLAVVTLPTGPGATTPEGGTFVDNGVTWRVLADNTKIDGTKLIITEEVYNFGYIAYNTSTTYVLYENSNLKKNATYGMDVWYAANVSADLKAVAVPYAYKPGHNGNEHDWINYNSGWSAGANDPNALTVPDLSGASGHGYLFALSISECNTYLKMFANGSLLAHDSIGGNRVWWLRSPGNSNSNTVSCVGSLGGITTVYANSTAASMRPACWVYFGGEAEEIISDAEMEEAMPDAEVEVITPDVEVEVITPDVEVEGVLPDSEMEDALYFFSLPLASKQPPNQRLLDFHRA